MIEDKKTVVEANRMAWNEAADYHRDHETFACLLKGFGIKGFSCLDDTLTDHLLSLNLPGKSVAQVCCNNGREILSVKNLGAGKCLGIDQAENFLAQARELAGVGGIDCEFLCSDIYDLPKDLTAGFDIALITIGVFGWMPDLPAFFRAVSGLLKPGGRLLIYEDHPILNMYEDDPETPHPPRYSYFDPGPHVDSSGLDYYGHKKYDGEPNYWHSHKLSDILNALIGTGFLLKQIDEFPHDIGTWEAYEDQSAQLPLSMLIDAAKT